MTDAPLDLSPIEDRDAHTECVALCHQPQADRRALLAEVKRARVRLARYEVMEARIRAIHEPCPSPVGDVCAGCPESWPCPTIAALDEPEAPT